MVSILALAALAPALAAPPTVIDTVMHGEHEAAGVVATGIEASSWIGLYREGEGFRLGTSLHGDEPLFMLQRSTELQPGPVETALGDGSLLRPRAAD